MSSTEIFIVGTIITILVAFAIIPLLYAAVLDGRDNDAALDDIQAHEKHARTGT